MTLNKARKYIHDISDDIDRYGVYKVMKSDTYVFWNDDKKNALELVKEYYENEYDGMIQFYNDDKLDDDIAELERLEKADNHKVRSASGGDVIVIRMDIAPWQNGVVDVVDYETAIESIDDLDE
jgi:hypothetical protein